MRGGIRSSSYIAARGTGGAAGLAWESNLVVSNIPGPAEPLYMLGCPLQATYPVVPLADRHALSVGMTTVRDLACFGIYADRETLPRADGLARDIDRALVELLAGTH
jgi:hypothetical protein